MAVFFQQNLVQAAPVDTDADGDFFLFTYIHHSFDPVLPADVAGVDADFGGAALGGQNGQLVVKVDVRHQRQGAFLADFGKPPGGLPVGHRQSDDLTAGSGQLFDLVQGALHIRGAGIQHGLNGHGSTAADGHIPHKNLSGHFSYPFTITKISLNIIRPISASSAIMPAPWI